MPSTLAISTRSRSMTTHFIIPGDRSDAAVTGTNPSRIPRGPWPRRLVQVEAEQARGILRGDLAQVRLGHPGEHAVQEVAGLGPRRLGVGEIAAPQHGIDADQVAKLDAEIVFHELHEHVAAPVVAR